MSYLKMAAIISMVLGALPSYYDSRDITSKKSGYLAMLTIVGWIVMIAIPIAKESLVTYPYNYAVFPVVIFSSVPGILIGNALGEWWQRKHKKTTPSESEFARLQKNIKQHVSINQKAGNRKEKEYEDYLYSKAKEYKATREDCKSFTNTLNIYDKQGKKPAIDFFCQYWERELHTRNSLEAFSAATFFLGSLINNGIVSKEESNKIGEYLQHILYENTIKKNGREIID